MASVHTMKEFVEQTRKFVEANPDMIPVALDLGFGACYAPSKKKRYFVYGDIRIPAEVFKLEFQECLTTIQQTRIVAFVFVPNDMVSDKVVNLLQEKSQ